jgi:hypothetical protein
VGYANPAGLMAQLGISIDANFQMPYVIRVWAIRDIVIALLVVLSDRTMIKTLLLACMAIDMTDVLSAYWSGLDGLFDPVETRSLQLTAIAALIPESLALLLLIRKSDVSMPSKSAVESTTMHKN